MSTETNSDSFAELLASGMSPEEIVAELKARQEAGQSTPLGNETIAQAIPNILEDQVEDIEEFVEEIHEKPAPVQEDYVTEEKEEVKVSEQPTSSEPVTSSTVSANRSATKIYVDNYNMLYRRLLVDLKSIKSLALLDVSEEDLEEMENAVSKSKEIGDLFGGETEPTIESVNTEWLKHYSSISRIHRKYFRLSDGEAKKGLIQGVFDTFNGFTEDPEKLVKMKSYAQYLSNETEQETKERLVEEKRIADEATAKAKADAANMDILNDFASTGDISSEKLQAKTADLKQKLDDSLEEHEEIMKTVSGKNVEQEHHEIIDNIAAAMKVNVSSRSAKPTSGAPASSSTGTSSSSTLDEDEDEDGDPVDDDDDDDTTSAGFLARMEALENSLTADYEIEEGEVPTLEKIEEIKREYGDMAAKEYIASMSQEDREEIARQLIEKKTLEAQAKSAIGTGEVVSAPANENQNTQPAPPTSGNPFDV